MLTALLVVTTMKNNHKKYLKNFKLYDSIVQKMYKEYGWLKLPPEYNYFFQKNILRLLIRLSRYKLICRQLRKSQTCLEIGSGSGVGSLFLSQFCRSVTGLEVKPNEFEEAVAINLTKNVKFIKQDFFKHPKAKKYDNIVLLDVIEHMNVKEGIKMLKKIQLNLKPGGCAFIGTPSKYSFPYQSKISRAAHIKCYDQNEFLIICEAIFSRTLCFSMNDEVLHTGHPKMSWYYIFICFK